MASHRKVTKRRRALPASALLVAILGVAGLAWAQDGAGPEPDRPSATDTTTNADGDAATPQDGPVQEEPETSTADPAPEPALELTAPVTAEALEVTPLEGTATGVPAGALLVVQHQQPDGTWERLPLPTAVAEDGTFLTHVELGRNGPNQLRVVHTTTGLTSAPVTIIVG